MATKKKGFHILHLNINSLLPKINEICFVTYQPNASVIGISESKLDSSSLESEVDIEGYDVIRMNRSRRGGGAACYIKISLSHNHKSVFYPNIESKKVFFGHLGEYLDNSLKESSIFNTQKFYLIGDFNVNFLGGYKMLLEKQNCDF